MKDLLRNTLLVSRPGLWATQLWFYLLPLGGRRLLDEPTFWLGAFYVMFPLSHLLYGWNDTADYQTDQQNPRKGNLLFGARLGPAELRRLPLHIAVVQAPFVLAFALLIGPRFLLWVAAVVAVNTAYNHPRVGLKGRPGWDLICQAGYLLVFVLSSWLNEVPQLPWPAFVFGALFAMHSHLFHEVTDLTPDAAAGRRTTAVVIGAARSKLLVAVMLLVESALVLAYFDSLMVAAFLGLAGIGFLLDAWLRRDETISTDALKVVFVIWNVVAITSMYWVWREALFAELG